MASAVKPAQNIKKAQRGIMTTDGLLSVTNWIYLLSLFVAAVASVGLWRLSIASGEEKDRQLEQYKTQAAEEIEKYKADAGVRIAQATGTAETAKAEAARANERAAMLEKEAAEARAEQERLKLRSIELEWKLSKIIPRQLNDEQISRLAAALVAEKYKPKINIDYSDDTDAISYAEAISSIFKMSGVKISESVRVLTIAPLGLSVRDRTGFLQRVLSVAQIEFTAYEQSSDNEGPTIFVGKKPLN